EFLCTFEHPQLQLVMCSAQLGFRQHTRGDIDTDQHHAGDLIVTGAVGLQARQVPAAVRVLDLALHAVQLCEHAGRIVQQLRIVQRVRDVDERAAAIGGDQVE